MTRGPGLGLARAMALDTTAVDRIVSDVIRRTLGRPGVTIHESSRLAADLGASDDDRLEAVIEIEKALGIDIQSRTPVERIATIMDLRDAVDDARRYCCMDRGD